MNECFHNHLVPSCAVNWLIPTNVHLGRSFFFINGKTLLAKTRLQQNVIFFSCIFFSLCIYSVFLFLKFRLAYNYVIYSVRCCVIMFTVTSIFPEVICDSRISWHQKWPVLVWLYFKYASVCFFQIHVLNTC